MVLKLDWMIFNGLEFEISRGRISHLPSFEVYKVNETETKTSLNIFLFAWSVKSVNDTVILRWSNDSKSV